MLRILCTRDVSYPEGRFVMKQNLSVMILDLARYLFARKFLLADWLLSNDSFQHHSLNDFPLLYLLERSLPCLEHLTVSSRASTQTVNLQAQETVTTPLASKPSAIKTQMYPLSLGTISLLVSMGDILYELLRPLLLQANNISRTAQIRPSSPQKSATAPAQP